MVEVSRRDIKIGSEVLSWHLTILKDGTKRLIVKKNYVFNPKKTTFFSKSIIAPRFFTYLKDLEKSLKVQYQHFLASELKVRKKQ